MAAVWLALLVLVAPVRAQERWRLEPGHSAIDFELAAFGVLPVRGSFAHFDGEVWRNPDDAGVRVTVRIDATSLTMTSERYRDWARSAEFFDVQRHPDIRFRSDPVSEQILLHGGEISGRLRLRGVERTARFHLQPADCALTAASCTIRVAGEIDRRQFGMRTRRVTLSNRVVLSMRLLAMPAAPSSPAAARDQAGQRP